MLCRCSILRGKVLLRLLYYRLYASRIVTACVRRHPYLPTLKARKCPPLLRMALSGMNIITETFIYKCILYICMKYIHTQNGTVKELEELENRGYKYLNPDFGTSPFCAYDDNRTERYWMSLGW